MLLAVSFSALTSCTGSKSEPSAQANNPENNFFVFKKNSDGVVNAPEVEFFNPISKKKILFIGMNHLGPKHFYQTVADRIESWVNSETTSATLLKEFFTCSTSVYDTALREISKNSDGVQDLLNANLDYSALKLMSYIDSQISPLIGAFKLKKTACVKDVDQLNLRPQYLVARNVSKCDEAHSNQSACQWSDLVFKQNPRLSQNNGDLKIDQYPAGMQFMAMNAYRGLQISGEDSFNDDISWSVSYLVLDYRNWALVNKVSEALKTNDRVILPWGAMHVYGVKKYILELGFEQKSVRDIPFILPSDLGKWTEIDQSYQDQTSVAPDYDF